MNEQKAFAKMTDEELLEIASRPLRMTLADLLVLSPIDAVNARNANDEITRRKKISNAILPRASS